MTEHSDKRNNERTENATEQNEAPEQFDDSANMQNPGGASTHELSPEWQEAVDWVLEHHEDALRYLADR